MRLSRLAKQELLYCKQCGGGGSICELPVRELVRKQLLTIDRPQPFSNSPYTGLSVTLTKKGKEVAEALSAS